jgi:diaminohydroxyphosphoribosylaminopyrimidine deaminase/5-amino-6-(5-phosphoribosylamino)uracil reductase
MLHAMNAAAVTRPHPNPRVGAVVISAAGQLVGSGVHHGPGTPHAEVVALTAAGDAATGGTLVVTLEPCNHHGRTPPCTETIRDAGIRRVVVGTTDPDERVSGAGIARLRSEGIDVAADVASETVRGLDPGYFHHRRTGRARVTVKLAATLDGQVAAADGSSQWITGPEARADVHRMRAAADGIGVGAGTARADDPMLTARHADFEGPQPRPILIAGTRELPPDLALFRRSPLVYTAFSASWPDSAEVVRMPKGEGGVDLRAVVADLGARGIFDLMIEGGPTLATALARAALVDEYVLYLGARLGLGRGRAMFNGVFATLNEAQAVEIESVTSLGSDLKIVCRPAAYAFESGTAT